MPINKKVSELEDGETWLVEKTLRDMRGPSDPNKKAWRVWFESDHRTYYTMRAINLYQPGDKVSCTVKASEYNGQLYYWLDDIERVQKEELPL